MLSIAEAQSLAYEFIQHYPIATQLGFIFGEDARALYGQSASQVPSNIKGGYSARGFDVECRRFLGRVDVALGNQSGQDDFIKTLRHEVIGHFGLNTFSPTEKRALLDGIHAARHEPSMEALWRKIDRSYPDATPDERAEEVFAHICEYIEPYRHFWDVHCKARGEDEFYKTCIARTHAMSVGSLACIGYMVAQGLHDRSRAQQNFPRTTTSFRIREEEKPYHQIVADKIIAQLKTGAAPWQHLFMPGELGASFPRNPVTGKRYAAANALNLMAEGRSDPRWMTYNQARSLGAQVRRGEMGSLVQFWQYTERRDKLDAAGNPVVDANGDVIQTVVKLARPRAFSATVFNAGQMDGLPPPELKQPDRDDFKRAENILAASGATIRHMPSSHARYDPATDTITLPAPGQFPTRERYYAAALRELAHWTGHPSRLARDIAHPFGSEGQAKEELRAEIASMLLAEELDMGHEPSRQAACVPAWIRVLENDPLEIIRASRDAEQILERVMACEGHEQTLVRSDVNVMKYLATNTKIQASTQRNAEFVRSLMQATAEASASRAARDMGAKPQQDDDLAQHVADALRNVGHPDGNTLMVTFHQPGATRTALGADHIGPLVGLMRTWTGKADVRVVDDPVLGESHFSVFTEDEDADHPIWIADFASEAHAQALVDRLQRIHALTLADGQVPALEPESREEAQGPGQDAVPAISAADAQSARTLRAFRLADDATLVSRIRVPGADSSNDGDHVVNLTSAWTGEILVFEWAGGGEIQVPLRQSKKLMLGEPDFYSVHLKYRGGTEKLLARFETLDAAIALVDRLAVIDAYAIADKDEQAQAFARILGGHDPIANGNDATEGVAAMATPAAGSKRQYLAVPLSERDEAKALGAKWDWRKKRWYVPPGEDAEPLARWAEKPPAVVRPEPPMTSPEAEFGSFLREMGVIVDGHPVMDSQRHRVPVEGDGRGDKSGLYIGFLDGLPAGQGQNFRTDTKANWKSKGYTLSRAESARMRAQAAEKWRERENVLREAHEATAKRLASSLGKLLPAQSTPYLTANGIKTAKGIYTNGQGDTFISACDASGKLWTMQCIQSDGAMRFARDSRKEGCFHPIGGIDALEKATVLVIAEGYATASSVFQALGSHSGVVGAVVAFDAGNLEAVARALRQKYPTKSIVIAGDDDRHDEMTLGHNTGRQAAEAAARAVDGTAIFPVFSADESWPAGMPRLTPRGYKAHLSASSRLEHDRTLTEAQAATLRRDLLTETQVEMLNRLKRHTDFNDLARDAGTDVVRRQMRFVTDVVLEKERQRRVEHKQVQHLKQVPEKKMRGIGI